MPEAKKDLFLIKRIVFALALGLLSYFVIMAIIIPVSRFEIVIPGDNPDGNKVFRPAKDWQLSLTDSLKNKAIELKSREAFLLSRLEMTESDSISMSISLKDSSVALVVQGVTIYNAKIRSYSVSHAFKKADPFVLAQWLSTPFVVDTHYSSIPKTPVLYKKAPKDTIEAMSQLELDPLKDDLNPVRFTLKLDRKLSLNFEQSEKPEKGYLKPLRVYIREMMAIERKSILKQLVLFKPVEFIPEIKIVIDKKAARVIYRAIPENAMVAIRLQTN
jgi:hypothetical protein